MVDKKETLDGLEKLDPFFANIAKFEKQDKPQSKEDEMIGKSANRTLDEKWNIKLQFGTDFLSELFTFLSEMGCDTILRLTKQGIKIYVIDPSGTHLCYIIIDKTEMSEYINTDNIENVIEDKNAQTEVNKEPETETETIIYVEFDILQETILNSKYPTDIYFDTKEKNTMYLVNGKTIESKRLKSIDNQDLTTETYISYHEKLMRWIKDEESFIMNVSYTSFVNVLKFLDKKNVKKDKSVSKFVEINFRKNEVDFIIKNELKSSSIQLYGDDIATQGTRDVSFQFNLELPAKMAKLKFKNNPTFHLNEKLPLIIEIKFGAGKIKLYYLIAQRVESEEQTPENEQYEQNVDET